ncbi:hypothetical protein R3P38DRAFT_2771200 [Favolaschia claudopus]|uniref:Uncharacterized protein n=1 Tax=Favolaschia claudopus TaxID=2862362 RepID=A0AAW0CEI6_9AGAR
MNANSYSSSDGLPSLSSTPSWHSTPGLPSLPPNSEGWGSSPANNHHSILNHAGTPSPPTGAFNFDHHRSSSPLSSVEQQVDSRHHTFLPPTPTECLHDFVALGSTGGGLSQADLVTRLYMLAVQFSDMAERRRIAAAETPTDFTGLWKDLKIRLSGNFTFTKDQELCTEKYPSVVRDVIIEPSRTVYSTMHHDVLVRAAGSSVRNAFRAERRFAFDNPDLASAPASAPASTPTVSDNEDDQDPARPSKRTRTDNSENDPDAAQPRKRARVPAGKGKNKPRGGRIAAGEDFWGRVDEFFRKEVEDRGTNLTGPKWKPSEDRHQAEPWRGPAQAVGMHLAPTPRHLIRDETAFYSCSLKRARNTENVWCCLLNHVHDLWLVSPFICDDSELALHPAFLSSVKRMVFSKGDFRVEWHHTKVARNVLLLQRTIRWARTIGPTEDQTASCMGPSPLPSPLFPLDLLATWFSPNLPSTQNNVLTSWSSKIQTRVSTDKFQRGWLKINMYCFNPRAIISEFKATTPLCKCHAQGYSAKRKNSQVFINDESQATKSKTSMLKSQKVRSRRASRPGKGKGVWRGERYSGYRRLADGFNISGFHFVWMLQCEERGYEQGEGPGRTRAVWGRASARAINTWPPHFGPLSFAHNFLDCVHLPSP